MEFERGVGTKLAIEGMTGTVKNGGGWPAISEMRRQHNTKHAGEK